jgi:hypothetical protein
VPDEIKSAAQIAFSGQDPWTFLETSDPEKRAQMLAISNEYQKLCLLVNDDLSNKVINKLAEAMK